MADPGRKARAGRAVGVPSDLTLLAQAALDGSNDDRAMLLGACRQHAYAAAIRFGRKHHGAEDSAQDAAMTVSELLKRNALRPETVSGLIRILVVRDAYAAAQRRLREATIAGHAVHAREALDTTVEVETAEWAQRVGDAAAALPERLRRLVVLRHWDGRSLDAIARLLATSRRSISRLLEAADAALREKLRGLDESNGGHGPPHSAGDR